eukprot:11188852-Lingulodinium_polyedra.AAC.1
MCHGRKVRAFSKGWSRAPSGAWRDLPRLVIPPARLTVGRPVARPRLAAPRWPRRCYRRCAR